MSVNLTDYFEILAARKAATNPINPTTMSVPAPKKKTKAPRKSAKKAGPGRLITERELRKRAKSTKPKTPENKPATPENKPSMENQLKDMHLLTDEEAQREAKFKKRKSDKWWNSLTLREQKEYVRRHPCTKYRVNKGKKAKEDLRKSEERKARRRQKKAEREQQNQGSNSTQTTPKSEPAQKPMAPHRANKILQKFDKELPKKVFKTSNQNMRKAASHMVELSRMSSRRLQKYARKMSPEAKKQAQKLGRAIVHSSKVSAKRTAKAANIVWKHLKPHMRKALLKLFTRKPKNQDRGGESEGEIRPKRSFKSKLYGAFVATTKLVALFGLGALGVVALHGGALPVALYAIGHATHAFSNFRAGGSGNMSTSNDVASFLGSIGHGHGHHRRH